MPTIDRTKYKFTWEQALEFLRAQPAHQQLIYDSYLTADLVENCRRFAASAEFAEVLSLVARHAPNARRVLDVPGGNGLATFAFAKAGFDVTCVEPDPSRMVGRGAIDFVLAAGGLNAEVVDAYGESLPFEADSFDVVYVRQGLHHAKNLDTMVAEFCRVLRPGGIFLACREPVVADYGASLSAFLDAQVDHQLYGGEHAYTLPDYRKAIFSCLQRISELGPFDSIINLYPNTPEILRYKVLASGPGAILRRVLPDAMVAAIGGWYFRHQKRPARLFSFIATKPA